MSQNVELKGAILEIYLFVEIKLNLQNAFSKISHYVMFLIRIQYDSKLIYVHRAIVLHLK